MALATSWGSCPVVMTSGTRASPLRCEKSDLYKLVNDIQTTLLNNRISLNLLLSAHYAFSEQKHSRAKRLSPTVGGIKDIVTLVGIFFSQGIDIAP